MIDVRIIKSTLRPEDCIGKLSDDSCGGTNIFVGTTRNQTDKKQVLGLEFEVYTKMALKEMRQIALDASNRWPIENMLIYHREGTVLVGDVAVLIIAVAQRRDAAFEACRYAIDTLKETVPIWKKEVFKDGSAWVSPHP